MSFPHTGQVPAGAFLTLNFFPSPTPLNDMQ